MSATSSTVQPGLVLGGRYQLVAPIASGGMAQVWEGRDLSLTRPVAIKILHPHLALDQAFVTRFRREAQASARLSHSSIVAVYDTLSQEGVQAIVMELVEGRTLRSVLDEVGVLPPTDVIDIGVQISNALDVAHRAGIVHRDIKPANIMVGNDRRIMVTDFGIAKATKDDDLTHTGTLLGTAKYLAPEQVTGEPVDPRSDIYALGIVLFEAVTGQPPFQAATDAATALARLRDEVPRCRDRRADVPLPLDDAIARAMARAMADRFDRASSFRATLAGLDLTQVGPVPVDLANLPPPAAPYGFNASAPASSPTPTPTPTPTPATAPANPHPSFPPTAIPTQTPSVDPNPSSPPASAPSERKGGRKKEGRKARKAHKADQAQRKRAGGRQRPTKALAVVLIIGGLIVASMLIRSLGNRGDSAGDGTPLALREAIPFDPEGSSPYGENNETATQAIDSDPDTFWRTDSYARENFGGGLKSGVGLVLTLDGEQELTGIEVLVDSHEWEAEVYVGNGEFGTNGADFDPDVAGGPVATLKGGERAGASLDGASGSRVLLWITEPGLFDDDVAGNAPYPYGYALREVVIRG